MPKNRPLMFEEALVIASFDPEFPKRMIKEALVLGQNVQLVESLFSDPGGDYTSVTIDGVEVYRKDGF